MSETFTVSNTEAYTEADVKAVMQNTYEDILGFANRKLVDYSNLVEQLEYWRVRAHVTIWLCSGQRGAGSTWGAWPRRASI